MTKATMLMYKPRLTNYW